jgi:hypothetical protein
VVLPLPPLPTKAIFTKAPGASIGNDIYVQLRER